MLLEARREFQQAIDLSKKDPAVKLRSADLWRRYGWAATMGTADPENGWTMFHNARAIYLSLPGKDGGKLAEVLRGMAIASSKMGDLEDSLRACDEAEACATSDKERTKIWNTRAITLSFLDRNDEASDWTQKVLASSLDRAILATARQSLGIYLIKSGNARKALTYLEDDVLRAWAHVESGDHAAALKLAPTERPRSHWIRARAFSALGKSDEAIDELRRAIGLIEEGRAKIDTESARAAFQGSKQEIHALLIRLCAEKKEWEDAFLHAESARARSFLDFVSGGGTRDFSHVPPSDQARLGDLREKMDAERDPAKSEDLEAEFRRSLRRHEKERLVGAKVLPQKPLTSAQVRSTLAPDVTLLEYQITDTAIYAFVFTREDFRTFRLSVPVDEVLDAARDLSRVIAVARRDERTGKNAFFDWHFGVLGGMLLGEIPIEGARHLVVVPHGALHLVPFPALRVGNRYLTERCAVSLAPSASLHAALSEKARTANGAGSCLLVKDPTGTLEIADQEEEALRSRFGKDLAVLSGAAATRAAVLGAASRHGVLHFATHAVYRADRPEFSHLEVAGGEKLLASDLLALDLRDTRLVTLSACDSGRGDFTRAEEMMGLPRAFLRAGASSVLATLWPVLDHPEIAHLMREFYAALKTEAPAQAFRTAQTKAISRKCSPTVWAAFALIGG